jgi:hypothetical protein
MSKETKIKVARELASQLSLTEESIDTAMSEAAQLIEACVSSRRAVRLSSTEGQDVYRHTLEAMQALAVAQAKMADAHAGLKRMQQYIGIGSVAVIPLGDKPEGDKASTKGEQVG